MYSNVFGSETQYDYLFENFKVDNNPITEPINHMVNGIFDPKDVSDGKEYRKLSPSEAKLEKEKAEYGD